MRGENLWLVPSRRRARAAIHDLIGYSEGTMTIKASDDGYNVLYSGGLFASYRDHPR